MSCRRGTAEPISVSVYTTQTLGAPTKPRIGETGASLSVFAVFLFVLGVAVCHLIWLQQNGWPVNGRYNRFVSAVGVVRLGEGRAVSRCPAQLESRRVPWTGQRRALLFPT